MEKLPDESNHRTRTVQHPAEKEHNPMVKEAVLEKRIESLKTRLRKTKEGSAEESSRVRVRTIRKRLKRNQRKMRKLVTSKKKQGSPSDASSEGKAQ
jgi:hypothetical protein